MLNVGTSAGIKLIVRSISSPPGVRLHSSAAARVIELSSVGILKTQLRRAGPGSHNSPDSFRRLFLRRLLLPFSLSKRRIHSIDTCSRTL